jgi:hypothetical protein
MLIPCEESNSEVTFATSEPKGPNAFSCASTPVTLVPIFYVLLLFPHQ